MDRQRRTPTEVPRLRDWLDRLIQNYDALVYRGEIGYSQQEIKLYRDSLASAALACDGEFKRPVKARIRELLALGAASYGLAGGVPRPVSGSAEALADFAVCAVWPVVTAPEEIDISNAEDLSEVLLSSADDGYATFSSLTAIRALQEQGIPHARCVMVIECCEKNSRSKVAVVRPQAMVKR